MPKIAVRKGVILHYHPAAQFISSDDAKVGSSQSVTIPDLHGNAMKIIFILVQEGVLALTVAQYEMLARVYYKDFHDTKVLDTPPSDITEEEYNNAAWGGMDEKLRQRGHALTQASLDTFKRVLAEAKWNPSKRVRLLGDALADRGLNDLLILIVVDCLKKQGISVQICLSNHDVNFFIPYFRAKNEKDEKAKIRILKTPRLGTAASLQDRSRLYLALALEDGLVTFDELDRLVTVYLSCLGLVFVEGSYLYMHAPNGAPTLSHLMPYFFSGDDRAASTSLSLERLAEINPLFQTILSDEAQAGRFFEDLSRGIELYAQRLGNIPIEAAFSVVEKGLLAVVRLMYTLNNEEGFYVPTIYGHVGEAALGQGNGGYCLDTPLGKPRMNRGDSIVLFADVGPSAEIELVVVCAEWAELGSRLARLRAKEEAEAVEGATVSVAASAATVSVATPLYSGGGSATFFMPSLPPASVVIRPVDECVLAAAKEILAKMNLDADVYGYILHMSTTTVPGRISITTVGRGDVMQYFCSCLRQYDNSLSVEYPGYGESMSLTEQDFERLKTLFNVQLQRPAASFAAQ